MLMALQRTYQVSTCSVPCNTPQRWDPDYQHVFFLGKTGPHHIHVQFKIVTNLCKLAASVAGAQVSHYSKRGPLLLNVYHLSLYSYKVS